MSKVIRDCFGFALLRSLIGLKNSRHLVTRPIRCKIKINCDLITRVFPRLTSVTCICFEFSLVRFIVYVCCDWPLWLLWVLQRLSWTLLYLFYSLLNNYRMSTLAAIGEADTSPGLLWCTTGQGALFIRQNSAKCSATEEGTIWTLTWVKASEIPPDWTDG